MRTGHTQHSLPTFPVYSIGFISDDKVVLGGGGGAGRSGVKNKLRLYNVQAKKLDLLHELELAKDEDAPMTMAVNPKTSEFACGINSALEKLNAGENQNCRVYSVTADIIKEERTTQTLNPVQDVDDYQKITAFSPDASLLAVGCTNNEVTLLSYATLTPVSRTFSIPSTGGDAFDIDYLGDKVLVVGSKALYFLSLPSSESSGSSWGTEKSKGKSKAPAEDGELAALAVIKTLEAPHIPGVPQGSTCTFRSARFLPAASQLTLCAVINTTPPRSAPRGASRKAYLCTWQATSLEELDWKIVKTRSISNKSVTVFDVSPNGKLLAYGSSDLSVGILDSRTLSPLATILNAHEFPPTALRFNPSTSLLISGSADNSIRVIELPESLGRGAGSSVGNFVMYVVLAILVMLLAWMLQRGA